MKKLTFLIHPFYGVSDIFSSNGEIFPFKRITGNPVRFLEEAGREGDAMTALDSLNNYKQGVEFAKGGSLLILRGDPEKGYTEPERALFQYIQDEFHVKDYRFVPNLDLLGHWSNRDSDLEAASELITDPNELRSAQVYSFGESLFACVPKVTDQLHRKVGFNNPATILTRYCGAKESEISEDRDLIYHVLEDDREFSGYHDRINVTYDA